MSSNPYIGSSLDDLLCEDEILAEVDALAVKRVLAWQLEKAMQEKGLTKTEMAKAMKTSRTALNRLLDPNNPSITLNTLESAARAIGKRVHLELVDL
jgi:DNA-binding Xre family transcriptional regulator